MQAHVEVCAVFTYILFILKKEAAGEGEGCGQKIYLHDSCVIIVRPTSGPWTTLCMCTHKHDCFEMIMLKYNNFYHNISCHTVMKYNLILLRWSDKQCSMKLIKLIVT